MAVIRLLLADDHTLMRAGLRALLEEHEDMQVVAEADTAEDALEQVRIHEPDVAVVDIATSGLNGLEVARRARVECPGVRVLLLSMHSDQEYVREALQVGVAGYLARGAARVELELAVRAVAAGQTYLSPEVTQQAIRGTEEEQRDPLEGLTPRQKETLRLLAEGRTTREIARLLEISPKTVETHRAQLMRRLGIGDLAGLVRFAIRVGLIELWE